MVHRIACPECDAEVEVPEERLGRSVACGRCGTKFMAKLGERSSRRAAAAEADEGVFDRDELATRQFGPRRERRRRDEDYDEYEDDDENQWQVRRFSRLDFAAVRSKVVPPAVFLMVYSALLILGGFGSLFPAGYAALQLTAPAKPLGNKDKEDAVMMVIIFGMSAVCGLIAGPLIFWGAWRMKALRSYGLAITAAVLSSVTDFLICVAFFVIGAWPLIVLLLPDVRAAFDRQSRE